MASFEEFSDFVRDVTRYKRPISRETDIVYDLGVAGIDGERLAAALAQAYGLRLTDDECYRHFGDERAMTPWHLVMWLIGRGPRAEPLLVGDLFDRVNHANLRSG
jgi:2-succinyl-5-enolpyruvyl-6-hydroxy-3-cyclohexene-1-carboxylate synthase